MYAATRLPSKVAALFYIPSSNGSELLLPLCSQTFGVVSVLDSGHSDRCIAVPCCCFSLHFHMLHDVEQLFIPLTAIHLSFSSVRSLLRVFAQFLTRLSCSCMLRGLHIFWLIVPYQTCLLQILSSTLWLILSFS